MFSYTLLGTIIDDLLCLPEILPVRTPPPQAPPLASFSPLLLFFLLELSMDFPGGSDGKASVYNEGDLGLIPGSGRCAREGNGNPLQYYCLGNSMDRGAWKATVHGVAKSRTRLSNFTSLH